MSAQIAEADIPRLARGVRLRHDQVRGVWMLLAPERVLQPDPVGVEILKRIDGTRSLGAIVDDLMTAFVAERERVAGDVTVFLAGLAEKGMLEVQR